MKRILLTELVKHNVARKAPQVPRWKRSLWILKKKGDKWVYWRLLASLEHHSKPLWGVMWDKTLAINTICCSIGNEWQMFTKRKFHILFLKSAMHSNIFPLRQSGCNILQRPKIHQELTTNIKYWRASEHHSNKFILNESKEKIQTPQKVSPLQARWHAAERNFTVCCIFHFCGTMQHLLAFHLRVFQGALFHTSSIPTISCKHIESKCAHIVCTTAVPTIEYWKLQKIRSSFSFYAESYN